jgi:short-chain Z-isoprenyl diphosphate synthase
MAFASAEIVSTEVRMPRTGASQDSGESGPPPRHIAVIADGNRRWARGRGLAVADGYRAGAERVVDLVGWCDGLGVHIATVFLVSARNLEHRPADELAPMLEAIAALPQDVRHRHGWTVRAVGDSGALPGHLQSPLGRLNPPVDADARRVVNLAVGYDGHREILHAARQASAPGHTANPDDITVHLYNGALPAPDLIVRTAGEHRLSGFMLWQSFDASLHFCDALWPDFQRADLVGAVTHHQTQQRTFGL